MDAACCEDLARRLYGLVVRLSGGLFADQARWLDHVVDVGQHGLALENMAGMLHTARSPSPVRSAVTWWPGPGR